MSSVLSKMQNILTEFKDGMPDYTDRTLKKKLPPNTQPYHQEDRVSLLALVDRGIDPQVRHIPTSLEKNEVGVAVTPPRITRYIVSQGTSSLQTSRDIGSF